MYAVFGQAMHPVEAALLADPVVDRPRTAAAAGGERTSRRSQRQTHAVAARSHLAGLLAVEPEDRARRRAWVRRSDREQPLLDQAAIFGARGQFLADIAALLPIDAVQFVEPAIPAGSICPSPGRGCRPARRATGEPVILGEIGLGQDPAFGQWRRETLALHDRRERQEPPDADRPARPRPRTAAPRRARRAGRAPPDAPSPNTAADRRVRATRRSSTLARSRYIESRRLRSASRAASQSSQIASPSSTMMKSCRYLPCAVSSAA